MVNAPSRGSFGVGTDQWGSDCLPKHRCMRRRKPPVYALTPARCRKVKRIRQASAEAGEFKPRKQRW